MNWNAVMGARGVCRVSHREYNGEKYNNIKQMIYADNVDWTKVLNHNAQATQPAYQPQQQSFQQPQPQYQHPTYQPTQQPSQQQPQTGGYQPGQF